jgi:hypothetical protein
MACFETKSLIENDEAFLHSLCNPCHSKPARGIPVVTPDPGAHLVLIGILRFAQHDNLQKGELCRNAGNQS